MTKIPVLALAAAALFGAIHYAADPAPADAPAPFWQLHGAAPQSGEAGAVARLRLAARGGDRAGVVIAAR